MKIDGRAIPDDQEYTNSLGMKMVRIEPGSFEMGFEGGELPEDLTGGKPHRRFGDFDETPRHQVRIREPFYISELQITNSQYENFDPSHEVLRGKNGISAQDKEAVVHVSWHDAVAFCEWLSKKEGIPYRLPTEAEWEYACRAGTESIFYTGDSPPEGSLKEGPVKDIDLYVGETDPNPWGLYDMHGNVEEWCLDWYGPYVAEAQADPAGRCKGDFKVTRGGSHSTGAYYLRSANRAGTLPDDSSHLIGVRIVAAGMPKGSMLSPPPAVLWQKGVNQSIPSDIGSGPDPNKPFFDGPRKYVIIPEDAQGPLFSRHNHDPALARCANGDLLAIWYTCVREPGRELALAASRFRRGSQTWDQASPFWDAPDRNDHAPALWFDGKKTLYHFNGLSIGEGYKENLALVMRTSKDNGKTWSKARFVNSDRSKPSQPVPCVIRTRDGTIMFPSDASNSEIGRGSVLWMSNDEGHTWSMSGSPIAGIHAGFVELEDGRLMAFGRGNDIDDRMPMSISDDQGETWEYSPSPFPPIASGQRLVLMTLREGPILFCSFTGLRKNPAPMPIKDESGEERLVRGLFAALSLDEGKTWPYRRLVSDDGPGREVEAMDGRTFTMDFGNAEPLGYLAACQTEDGLIHLISSRQHYSFNLQWLKTPPPAEPGEITS